jgi:hypothetical protein
VRNFDWLPFTPPLVAVSGPSKRVSHLITTHPSIVLSISKQMQASITGEA